MNDGEPDEHAVRLALLRLSDKRRGKLRRIRSSNRASPEARWAADILIRTYQPGLDGERAAVEILEMLTAEKWHHRLIGYDPDHTTTGHRQ